MSTLLSLSDFAHAMKADVTSTVVVNTAAGDFVTAQLMFKHTQVQSVNILVLGRKEKAGITQPMREAGQRRIARLNSELSDLFYQKNHPIHFLPEDNPHIEDIILRDKIGEQPVQFFQGRINLAPFGISVVAGWKEEWTDNPNILFGKLSQSLRKMGVYMDTFIPLKAWICAHKPSYAQVGAA